MESLSVRLKKIISSNPELSGYSEMINDTVTENQCIEVISAILKDFSEFQGKQNRPGFYTELQLTLNHYGKDNPYPQNETL